ncbi:MAG: hypothetical protein CFE21_03995 [Bacteroidetes bacterium B1(2017)]|nr:MAG: hypothetical protein CFE21_03995 [Bacteroidetes bacterium B1(2017)]
MTVAPPIRSKLLPDVTEDSSDTPIPSAHKTRILHGLAKEWIEFKIKWNIFQLVLKQFKNPIQAIKIVNKLNANRRAFLGESRIKKIAKIGSQYYWDLYIPSWPSQAFDEFIEAEIDRVEPLPFGTKQLTNVLMAITKKCALKCEHCFEFNALNQKETLSIDKLKLILENVCKIGSSQIQLSGGEPLMRLDAIRELLAVSKPGTEFWVLSSGYLLSKETANILKQSNLTGVVISLDHFEEEKHNAFRGRSNSYAWVKEAIKNAQEAGLVTALSICITKSFATKENLHSYLNLAKEMGVAFVQLLEPKASGGYAGLDVSLTKEQEQLIEEVYWQYNYEAGFESYPILVYHGYYQRRAGCFAAGNRTLYIDTDGDMHACPFCNKKSGSALVGSTQEHLHKIKRGGCATFKTSTL